MEWKWTDNGKLCSAFRAEREGVTHRPSSMPADWNKHNDSLRKGKVRLSDGPAPRKPCGLSSQGVSCSEPALRKASAESSPTGAAKPYVRRHHHNRIPGLRSDAAVCPGQAWTVALCALWGCRDAHGLEASLDFMGRLNLSLVPSELTRALAEFDLAIRDKRASLSEIFTPSAESLLVSVEAKFKQEATACLPLHVLQFILGFVDLSENGVLCSVSKEFREAAEGDAIWREAYQTRFPKEREATKRQGGQSLPAASASTAAGGAESSGDEDAVDAAGTSAVGEGEVKVERQVGGFKQRYNDRMQDPHVGDQVQVAWKGKFRLESFEVYNGTAWWVARVVGKGERPGYYKVHYPGWEEKWDEWVPRGRLRWGNDRVTTSLAGATPKKGDSVEVWCQGLHVPGAWLEAVVHSVEESRLFLGEVLASGRFWVDAEHVRLVKQCVSEEVVTGDQREETFDEISTCHRGSALLEALSDAGFTSGDAGCYCFCCVM